MLGSQAIYSLVVMMVALTAESYVLAFFGISLAALALTVRITYGSVDRVDRFMGPAGSRTVTRLAAFLLLCVGVQILITGVEDVLTPLLALDRNR